MAAAYDDVDRPDQDVAAPTLRRLLTGTVVPWLRFVGPARLLASAGGLLVLIGVGWWMLRSPAAPTESRLPLAGGVAAADVTGTGDAVSPPVSAPAAAPVRPASTAPAVVVVHVAGAVRNPGVYELTAGQRVADAVGAAGGALAGADPDALNLAAPVADGDRIAVPTREETAAAGVVDGGHTRAGDGPSGDIAAGLVDLNTATVAELESLPGIGPATAAAIVEHREQHGPFASVDELDEVRGIGTVKLAAIRDQVTV